MKYNLRRLKPKYLRLTAQEQLMGYPNANRNKFSTHIIQEDVMIQVSSNFLHVVEQIKTELAILRQEMRDLRVELQEHRGIAKKEVLQHGLLSKEETKKVLISVIIVIKMDISKMVLKKDARWRKTESTKLYVL